MLCYLLFAYTFHLRNSSIRKDKTDLSIFQLFQNMTFLNIVLNHNPVELYSKKMSGYYKSNMCSHNHIILILKNGLYGQQLLKSDLSPIPKEIRIESVVTFTDLFTFLPIWQSKLFTLKNTF